MPDLSRDIPTHAYEPVATQLARIAQAHWSHAAIEGPTSTYDYGQLWTEVLRLCTVLNQARIQPGQVVAIATRQSCFGAIAAMLAVLRQRCVLVFLDQTLPQSRINDIVRLSEPALIFQVGDSGSIDAACQHYAISDWPADLTYIATPHDMPLNTPIEHQEPAYLFFTSGSTGEPKGVLGAQLGLAHFLDWQRTSFPLTAADRHAQLTALSFDVVLRDILYPLSSGATLVIPPREYILDARKMLQWFNEQHITSLHCVPSLMKAWLRSQTTDHPLRSLRQIFFAGEPLIGQLVEQVRQCANNDLLVANFYGPTETTLAKLCHVVTDPVAGIQPIGLSQPGVDVLITRDRQALCEPGEVGEIAIRTPYRSLGYFNNPTLTVQSFLPNPFRSDSDPNREDLVYFTGDLGRQNPDGLIEIFGRIDAQIKINGLRIEPIEIENALIGHPAVNDAAITVRVDAGGEKTLWAVLALNESATQIAVAALHQALRVHLKSKFPDAMIPRQIHLIESLPYLPNGKINRKAINELTLESPATDDHQHLVGLDPVRQKMIQELQLAIGQPITDLHASFASVGGDSLSAIRVSLLIEEFLGVLPDGWEHRSFLELSVCPSEASNNATGQTPWLSAIDTPVLLRAIAILLVVVSHTGISFLNSTALLFAVSGHSFGRFLAPNIMATGNLKATWRFIAKFAIPAGLYQLARAFATGHFWLPDLLLMGTLIQNPDAAHYTFWFLDILTANLLILSAFVLLLAKTDATEGFRQRGFAIIAGLTLLFMVLAISQESQNIWNGAVGRESVGPIKWLWIITLGWAVVLATQIAQRCVLTGLLLALVIARYTLDHPVLNSVYNLVGDFTIVGLLVLIWIKRIPLLRLFKPALLTLSLTSLFTYLVNWPVMHHLMPALKMPAWPALQIAMALSVGIAGYYLWNCAWGYASRFCKRAIS